MKKIQFNPRPWYRCGVAVLGAALLLQPAGAMASALLLSNLVNGGTLTAGGVTFSGFETLLGVTQQNQIALDAFVNGPNDIALRIRPPDTTNNPYGIKSQNCVAAGPGICVAPLTDLLTYNVSSNAGNVSAMLMFSQFQQNIGGNSFYNDATVQSVGPHGMVVTNNCGAVNDNFCGGLVSTAYKDLDLGTAFTIDTSVRLQYSGLPLVNDYRIGVTGMEQHFLLNGVTVIDAVSASSGAALLSNASLVVFPVPAPPAFAVILSGLVGLAVAKRRQPIPATSPRAA